MPAKHFLLRNIFYLLGIPKNKMVTAKVASCFHQRGVSDSRSWNRTANLGTRLSPNRTWCLRVHAGEAKHSGLNKFRQRHMASAVTPMYACAKTVALGSLSGGRYAAGGAECRVRAHCRSGTGAHTSVAGTRPESCKHRPRSSQNRRCDTAIPWSTLSQGLREPPQAPDNPF